MKVSVVMMLSILPVWYLISVTCASSNHSVIIIGAGMSGISAAKALHSSGINDFVILEATNRIGGRIHRAEFCGHAIELGANWLTGVGKRKENPLFKIAKRIKLKNTLSDYSNVSSNTYKQAGGLYSKDEVEAVMRVAQSIQEFGANLSKQLSLKTEEDDVSILVMQRLHDYNKVPLTPLEMMIDYYMYDYEFAEPPSLTSLKYTLPTYEYENYGHSSYFISDPRGFESIVHYIAKQFLSYHHDFINDSRIKLNQIVEAITYSKNGATVKTEDGSIYHAKVAVVSVSLGVLQSNLIEFRPTLPEWKIRAIDQFSMASYTKVFLKFPYKFWPTGPGTEFFFYVHKRRGYYPVWQHLENEMPGSNILFALITGQESMRIEQQPDEETKKEAMNVLRKIFGSKIPEPDCILVPRWRSNKYYRGSFANWPFGYSNQRHKQLKAPVSSIYFTGEHTSSKYFGYTDGAYIAGMVTAKEVIKHLKRHSLWQNMEI